MISRTIELTLSKAKEWYNSGNEELKEIALQAYSEEELTAPEFASIKTFDDAIESLGLDSKGIYSFMTSLDGVRGMHLIALFKLDIIRMALNGGHWKSKMTSGDIYIPRVRICSENLSKDFVRNKENWSINGTFESDGNKYSLIGGDCHIITNDTGLGNVTCGVGYISVERGLLSCRSKEIAQHMSYYFTKEIFEACYAHHFGVYKWCY